MKWVPSPSLTGFSEEGECPGPGLKRKHPGCPRMSPVWHSAGGSGQPGSLAVKAGDCTRGLSKDLHVFNADRDASSADDTKLGGTEKRPPEPSDGGGGSGRATPPHPALGPSRHREPHTLLSSAVRSRGC